MHYQKKKNKKRKYTRNSLHGFQWNKNCMSKYGTAGSVHTRNVLIMCNNDTHTGEETVDESLLQGAYEAIALRPERILISEQLEVENPVKEGGTRAHDAGFRKKTGRKQWKSSGL
jgi:hypothetical protein